MKLLTTTEIILSLVLLVVGIILINPFGVWMPMAIHLIVLAILAVLVGLFAGLVIYSHVPDERERDHESRAGKLGYVTGLIAVSLAIVVEVIRYHSLDRWLPAILLVMVMANVVSRAHSRYVR